MAKRLKKIQKKLKSTTTTTSSNSLNLDNLQENNTFEYLHSKLLSYERKLKNRSNDNRTNKRKHLTSLNNTVTLYIKELTPLIHYAKKCNLNEAKLNFGEIYLRLLNSLKFPCYLITDDNEEAEEDVGNDTTAKLLNIEPLIKNFEKCLNLETSENMYRLCSRENLPPDYVIDNQEDDNTTMDGDCYNDIRYVGTSYLVQRTPNNKRVKMSSIKSSKSSVITSPSPTLLVRSNNNKPSPMERMSISSESSDDNHSFISLNIETKERVTVTHIESPECFYVQPFKSKTKFNNLNIMIKNYIRQNPPIVNQPEENELYLIRYEMNKTSQWCRGRLGEKVCEFGKNIRYNVKFIDYGNSQVVPNKNIRKINTALTSYPPFALHCQLYNLYPINEKWDNEAIKYMAQIVNDNETVMMVMNKKFGSYEVDLLCISENGETSLREALIFIGVALPHNESVTQKHLWEIAPNKIKLYEKQCDLKELDELDIVITYALDPYNVYVQEYNFLSSIQELNDSMKEFYKNKKDYQIFSPKVDMIVAVSAFVDYGQSSFFRGRIKEIFHGQASVKVQLVDIGLDLKVPWTSLRAIQTQFTRVEVLTFAIRLADIKPKGDSWSPLAIEYLKNLEVQKTKLRMIVKKASDQCEVVLFEEYPAFDICINATLVDDGHAESTGDSSTTVKRSKIIKTNETPETVTMSILNTTNDQEPIVKTIENDDRLYKEVTVLDVESPDLFYVSFNDKPLTTQYNRLQKDLQAFYTSHSQPNCDTELSKDVKCIVYHKHKKCLFRACIIEANSEDYHVWLYDIAESIVVPNNEVWSMHKEIAHYPNFSYACHLAGIKPSGGTNKWSLISIEYFKDIIATQDRIFVTKKGLIDVERKSIPVIMLYLEYIDGGPLEKSKYNYVEINTLLVNKGLAFKTICKEESKMDISNDELIPFMSTSNTITNHLNIDWNDLVTNDEQRREVDVEDSIEEWPKSFEFKTMNFDAIATYVDHDGGIFLYDIKLQPVLDNMESEMKLIFQNTPSELPDTKWNVGDLCTVRYFVNTNWYRGKVIRINNKNSLQVLMVDFGNDEECKYVDIRKKIVYTKIPTFSSKVYLHGLDKKSKWITSDLDLLHSIIVDKQVHVQIKKNYNGKNQTAYIFMNGENVNNILLNQNGMINSSQEIIEIDDDTDTSTDVILENEVDMLPLSSCLNSMKILSNYIYVALPETDTFNITIINVIKYNELIVEILNCKINNEQFQMMSKEINEIGQTMAHLDNVRIGQVCIALYDEDKKWYRAEIVQLNDDNRTITVRFVDFGNYDGVPINNIRYIKSKWLEVPVEQYVAKLSNIELVEQSYVNEVFNYFETLYYKNKRAKVLSREPFCIDMYEPEDVDVLSYKSLLDRNLIRLKG